MNISMLKSMDMISPMFAFKLLARRHFEFL